VDLSPHLIHKRHIRSIEHEARKEEEEVRRGLEKEEGGGRGRGRNRKAIRLSIGYAKALLNGKQSWLCQLCSSVSKAFAWQMYLLISFLLAQYTVRLAT